MKRKILSLILVFAMTVSLLTVGTGAVEPTYGDTAGHWAESSIERWSAYGIIQGSNGQFDPNGQLTCAQLATILAKLLKLPAAKDAGFTDNTADAWYYDAINRCAAAGILNGNGDGTVTPEAPITRERAMVMLARALGIEPIRKPDLTKYTDAAQVSAYAQGYVAALIEAGIVGGVTADELAPQDNINRASTVTILDRAISTYADQAGTTVKADGKGIVLVVAENVKITNAPEGTKIVVADGATGLTVNGKSVSDDQTYIVPKATTGSGSSSGGSSHSHSYDTTTHKCSCGEFDPAVVATIGDETGYLTLKEAVAAVPTNNTATTIKLLKNTSGDGIDVNANQNIIFDFGGHTYTLQGRMVGSAGTETNGFRFLQGATVTLKNGSLLNGNTVSEDFLTNTPAKVMVNSYANLVLDDFSINASTTGVQREGSGAYGTAALYITSGPAHVKGSGSYTARDGQYAIYMANVAGYTAGADLYFDEDFTGTVRGKVTSGNQQTAAIIIKNGNYDFGEITLGTSTMIIAGGTFSSEPDNKYIAAGYVATANTNGTWTVSEKAGVTLVAQVGVNKYESLADAISAVQEGNTIKMLKDVDNAAGISVNTGKTFTIDFDGHTYKVNKPGAGSTGTETAAFQLIKGQTITFKNGTICADADNLQEATPPAKNILRFFQSYANVDFVDMTIDGTNIYGDNSVIEFANGNVSITGSTSITAKPGAKAINVDTWKIDSYSGGAHVTINTTGSIGDIYLYSEGNKTEGFTKSTLSISGGIFGSVTGDDNKEYTASITGGTFSSDPTAYVAEGYITLVNNNTFTVSKTNEIPVTTATVQNYLDGKYGSINGKTLVLGGDNYGKIEFGRATAYAGSNTEYYLSGTKSTPDAIKQDIAGHPNGGAGAREYVRYMSNVTLKAADGATVTINGLVAFGGQVNNTKWYSRDFVADREMPEAPAYDNNISYWIGQKWSNITFEGLTFTGGVDIEAYGNKDTLIDNVKFDNCKFNVSDTDTNKANCIRLNVDGKVARANNLVVENCEFTDGYTAVLTDGMPNVTVRASTFSGLTKHAINPMMNWNGAPGYGEITVTGNTFKNMSSETEDNKPAGTILRMGKVGAGAVFTIQDNTATEGITLANSIKVNSLAADGITYNISGNKWGSLTANDPRLNG